jgi:hypothetical protein
VWLKSGPGSRLVGCGNQDINAKGESWTQAKGCLRDTAEFDVMSIMSPLALTHPTQHIERLTERGQGRTGCYHDRNVPQMGKESA